MNTIAEMEEQLRWKSRCLALILEIYRIRDENND